MASAGDTYLPDLAKVFARNATVFSWDTAFNSLYRRDYSCKSVDTLISSSQTAQLLAQQCPSFPPPSQQSRQIFDRKISAINLPPGAEKQFETSQIREDTAWLSKEAALSEIEASRVVALEWELRPKYQLWSGYSEAEQASLTESFRVSDSDTGRDQTQPFPQRSEELFNTLEARRQRILRVYFKERTGLFGVKRELQRLALEPSDSVPKTAGKVRDLSLSNESPHNDLKTILDDVDSRLQAIASGKDWSIAADDTNEIWTAAEFQNLSLTLQLVLLRLRSPNVPASTTQTVLRWLQIVSGCEYFATLQPSSYLAAFEVETLQYFAALVTIAVLDPASAVASLSDTNSQMDHDAYYLNTDAADEIHTIIFAAAEACVPQAAPAVLSWAIILDELRNAAIVAKDSREGQRNIEDVPTIDRRTGRRTSYGSLQQSVYEEVCDRIVNTSPISDPISYLVRCAVEADHALEVVTSLASFVDANKSPSTSVELQVIQELITVSVSNLAYTPEVLSAQFALLDVRSTSPLPDHLYDPKESFIRNDFLMDNVFAIAAARFPYESLPFLRLCKNLAQARIYDDQGTQYITYRLRTLDTFMTPAVGPFGLYQTIREDENLNLVSLEVSADMLRGSQNKLLTNTETTSNLTTIPAETVGEVVSEGGLAVIKWQYSYSGLALLGAWLELHYHRQLQPILPSFESASEVAAEIISLLRYLLESSLGKVSGIGNEADRRQLQDSLISEASAGLEGGMNIIGYIFEIAEQELQAFRRRPSNAFNTSLVVSCIDFMTVFAQIRQDQFWASIYKSSILGTHGSDSILSAIVSTAEVPKQTFDFLAASSRLYAQIIVQALQKARSVNVGGSLSSASTHTPQMLRVQTSLLLSLTQTFCGIFEALPEWTFALPQQQRCIVDTIARSLEKIITISCDFGEIPSKLNVCFIPSCSVIEQQLRASPEDVVGPSPIIKHLIRNAERQDMHQQAQPKSLISLARILIRKCRKTSTPPSSLELQLLNAVAILVRIVSVDNDSVGICLDLIQDLLTVVATAKPVSLLGHLGSVSSVNFLEILQDLQSCDDLDTQIAVWQLLASFVGRDQQWLAIVILTGSPPDRTKEEKKTGTSTQLRGSTLISLALDRLVSIATLPPSVATAMLEFVIQAQQNWSWTSDILKSKENFLPAMVSYIVDIFVDASAILQIACRNKIAALVTDLITTHLHQVRVTRDKNDVEFVLTLTDWLTKNAIGVEGYNSSLHTNLRKNFASKFSGLDVSNFRRGGLSNATYGEQFYYDLTFAGEVLQSEKSWRTENSDQSFSAEFRRANLNLSLVDSELAMLHSFQNFCTEHCGWLIQQSTTRQNSSKDLDPHAMLAKIVETCLKTNTQVYPDHRLFETLFQSRADLAIAILQALADAKAKGFEMKSLLKFGWECARYRSGSYEQVMANADMTYWRSMLTIILLTLQFHIGGKWIPPVLDHSNVNLLRNSINDQIPTVLDVLTVVVGQGFKSVVTTIQEQQRSATRAVDDDNMVTPRDTSLILTIFETILRMSRVPEFVSDASERLISTGIIQSCLLLYSWSHTMIEPSFGGEPEYAAVSLQLLVGLSTLPPVAEEMAVEGVMSRLLGGRVTQQLQRIPEGARYLDQRPHCQFLYNLWTMGILPICLNLLHCVGAPVAAEVSVFLNQFSHQLSRAAVTFSSTAQIKGNYDSLTFGQAKEITTLALVSFILESYRKAGASAAVDPLSIMRLAGFDEKKKDLAEDITDILGGSAQGLKSRVIVTSEREARLAQSQDGDSNLLVKKIDKELRNAQICLTGGATEDEGK